MRYLCVFLAVCTLSAQQREPDPDHFQLQREQWFYNQRKFPLSAIPAGARLRGIERIKAQERARREQASISNPTWTLIGPQPTDSGTTHATAGRVNAIAIDPRNSNVVYIGAAEGGVWKTADGGMTWTPLTDNQASLANGSIALDPTNPDIVYVGTGEENFAGDSYYGAGILKSQDAGQTWINIVGPFLRDKIGALAIQPGNGQVLLASSLTGVWRSADAAQTWTRVLASSAGGPIAATSVLFDPSAAGTAFAAIGTIRGNPDNGVYQSKDGGLTWARLTGAGAGLLPTRSVGRIELAIAPSSSNILFASIHNTTDDSLLGIWKTTDSGQTWNQLEIGPALIGAWGRQLWYDNTIRVSPTDPNVVWAGALGLYRSLDGGATWTPLSFIDLDGVEIHVDQHQLAFSPDGTQLYIANDGGMYSTTGIGVAFPPWTNLNATLAITQFYPGLSVDPVNPSLLLGGTQDNGTQRYSGSIDWQQVTCGDGGYTALYPALSGAAYAACQEIEILRTDDGGSHWVQAAYGIDQTDNSAFIAPMVSDPSNGQMVYFGTYRVWQSRDGSGKYSPISPDLGANIGVLSSIAVAPSDPNTIYAGTNNALVWVTRNAGGSWQKITSGLPTAAVTRITVDPLDATAAYVTFSGFSLHHVWKTNNAGGAWTDVSATLPNLPVNDLLIDPDLPGTLYAATDAGVMASADSGASWNSFGANLPRVVVQSLSLQRTARLLRAATHGRGVWEIAVPLSGAASTQPMITSLSPAQIDAGGPAFSLSVTGANFGPGMTLRWNGQDRATSYVDNTHLTAQISASDIAPVGLISILVFSANPGGGTSNSVAFAIGPAPGISSASFVSAANPAGGHALAPLSLASLYGTNLAGGVSAADTAPPLPFLLGGISVTIGGVPAALLYVSPGQINLQVPSIDINRITDVPLVIKQGQFTTTISVQLQTYAPAIFTTNSQGSGQAAALINGTGSLAAPAGSVPGAQPATVGQAIALFCTGLGPVRIPVGDGAPAPSTPDASITTPALMVGGVAAVPLFAGLAPGFVGLYQVNFVVPAGAPSGDAIPVILTTGGIVSNTATIAIQ